jgi:hypothetical protein
MVFRRFCGAPCSTYRVHWAWFAGFWKDGRRLLFLAGDHSRRLPRVLLGRYILGGFAAKLKRGRFKKIDEVTNYNGLLFVLGLRLAVLSHTPLNYAAGTIVVTLKQRVSSRR